MDEQGLPLPSAHADMLQIEFAYRQHETRVSIQVNTVSILIPTQVRVLAVHSVNTSLYLFARAVWMVRRFSGN